MTQSNNSNKSGSRMEQLVALLLEAEGTLRARIRSRRSRWDGAWDTSDAFASVVRRAVEVQRRHGIRALGTPAARADGVSASRSPTKRREIWAFLESILRAVVGDQRRKEIRDRRIKSASQEAAMSESTESGRHQPQSRSEMRSEIEAMLSHLGEADQSLLRLRLGGMPWDDVAAATGLTAPDCRQRWSRLIRQIRTRMGIGGG